MSQVANIPQPLPYVWYSYNFSSKDSNVVQITFLLYLYAVKIEALVNISDIPVDFWLNPTSHTC